MKSLNTLAAILAAAYSVIGVMLPHDAPDGILEYTGPKHNGSDHERSGLDEWAGWRVLERFDHASLHDLTIDDSILADTDTNKRRQTCNSGTQSNWPVSDWGCQPLTYLSPSDYTLAKSLLNRTCDSGLKIGDYKALVAKVGSAAVYACSWWGSNYCGSTEIEEAMRMIDEDKCCYRTIAGWLMMNDWAKSYGRGEITEIICDGIEQIGGK